MLVLKFFRPRSLLLQKDFEERDLRSGKNATSFEPNCGVNETLLQFAPKRDFCSAFCHACAEEDPKEENKETYFIIGHPNTRRSKRKQKWYRYVSRGVSAHRIVCSTLGQSTVEGSSKCSPEQTQ